MTLATYYIVHCHHHHVATHGQARQRKVYIFTVLICEFLGMLVMEEIQIVIYGELDITMFKKSYSTVIVPSQS